MLRTTLALVLSAVVGCAVDAPRGGAGGAGGEWQGSSSSGCAEPCGASCCGEGSVCADDGAGKPACALRCSASNECPPAKGCCAPVEGRDGVGACVVVESGAVQACRCAHASECESGCCAPLEDASKNPIGPFVCRPNDGAPYHCCNGATFCDSGCCVELASVGSHVCEEPCNSAANCGPGRCMPAESKTLSGTCNGAPGGCEPAAN